MNKYKVINNKEIIKCKQCNRHFYISNIEKEICIKCIDDNKKEIIEVIKKNNIFKIFDKYSDQEFGSYLKTMNTNNIFME